MKTVLTGVKATGMPHLGNYLGAMKPALGMAVAPDTRSLFFMADYHSLIDVHDPLVLQNYTRELAAAWLACGLDPKKTIIYRQSDIPEIFELTWILNCFSPKGLMNRGHAYKARIAENTEAKKPDPDYNVTMGLFTYPVLMAADILMFDTDQVPVGEDQLQHLEITRDIAQKINHQYGPLLKVPTGVVRKETKLVPGLDGRKMSKSYNNHIPLFLEKDKMRSMIMKIKTDSTPPEAPKSTEGSIIFDIYKEFATPAEVEALAARYAKGIGWGEAKQALFEVVDREIEPKREVYKHYMGNPADLDKLLVQGADQARAIAKPILAKLKKGIGITG